MGMAAPDPIFSARSSLEASGLPKSSLASAASPPRSWLGALAFS